MSNVRGTSVKEGVSDLSLDAINEMDLEQGLFELPELGLFGDDVSVEDLALDDVGLGAVKGRNRRARMSAKLRRKLSRLAKKRGRNKKGRFAGLAGKARGGKRRKKATMADLGATKKRRRRGGRKVRVSGKLRRKLSRLAKGRKRTKKGRFAGLAGMEMLSLSGLGDDSMMDLFELSQQEGLGAVKSKSKRRRRGGRKARIASRRRRGSRKARRGGMAGLGRLANVTDGLSQVEVASSMPVVGVFQWLATGPGLEALGGVALAPVVGALVAKALSAMGLNKKNEKGETNVLGVAAGAIVSAIAMWELGRLVGSAGIAKFGSFYSIGRALEDMVIQPLVLKNIGLGDTQRTSDMSNKFLGRVVLPDETDLVGIGDTQRFTDTAPLGQVLLPGVRRGDYAVNPLSGMGTVREDDTANIGDGEDLDDVGQEIIPDTEMEGVGAEEGSDLF
jgi:hypothetical protein